MEIKILKLGGKRWVVLPEKEYRRLSAHAGEAGPKMPKPDADGNFPGVAYARASLARKIIKMRRVAGVSQAELARRAGIRAETLNRIERGRTTPDVATIAKIERALELAMPEEN